jgi:integrase
MRASGSTTYVTAVGRCWSRWVKPKVVQAILRHAKLSTTMDLYVHAYDEDLRDAVRGLESAIG